MSTSRSSRREFLKSTAGVVAGLSVPYFFSTPSRAAEGKNDRPLIGCIGTGDRWKAIGPEAMKFGDIVAVCDVDRRHAEFARERAGGEADIYEDYRKLLDRKEIEIVTIATPDHWHSKIAIEAMRAGKDVYCEKPLTLTIDEGKKICKVRQETKRVFQVGTQQRSEMGGKFLQAVALVREGRIGKVQRVNCSIGAPPTSGKLPVATAPSELNWELWLGQAPLAEYVSGMKPEKGYPQSRCHYEFRWWYEYSGGKMTDWGAHHVDIAQWAIGAEQTGPISVFGTAKHPVPLEGGQPTVRDQYNVATQFNVLCKFKNGVELTIRHDGENGITFTGEEGEIFVNRDKLTGKAVEELKEKPLPEDALLKLYKGKKPGSHMGNFIECCQDRSQPISDVESQHRSITTCHLANIAIRLNRPLKWDPDKQEIVGDSEAAAWLSRESRKGYELTV